MLKIYSLKTIGKKHVLPVGGATGNRYVEFRKTLQEDKLAYFQTEDRKLQESIEASVFFERGDIEVFYADEESPSPSGGKPEKANGGKKKTGGGETGKAQIKEFPDVKTFAQARDVLGGEPYNIKPTSPEINSAEKMLAKAGELGVAFPNLVI